jgi:magnesium-transporting ATPase (P-type)
MQQVQVWNLWDKSRGYKQHNVELDEQASKSLLFNAFIFMQVFNEFNARKIVDEYNIFSGVFHSPIFMGVIFITAGLQALIMQTPISSIFKVNHLHGAYCVAPRHAKCCLCKILKFSLCHHYA